VEQLSRRLHQFNGHPRVAVFFFTGGALS